MRKLLLMSTAIAGIAMIASPAAAAVKMDVGGFFRGYIIDADNDVANLRETDLRRASELHFSGESTLDNGLTVGAHAEVKVGDADETDSIQADEIYGYVSGGWGRVNVGLEDGAAYLLQVGAPSADSNIDGMRVYIQGHGMATGTGDLATLTTQVGYIQGIFGAASALNEAALDYDHADFKSSDRLTYMTPKYSGFQAGISWAPEPGYTGGKNVPTTDNDGVGFYDASGPAAGNTAAQYEDMIEVSTRWDGEFQGFAVAAGAGYSTADLEQEFDAVTNNTSGDWGLTDGIDSWNVGLNVASQGFSLGGNYMVTKTEISAQDTVTTSVMAGDLEGRTYVVGGAYDNGPYHMGISYLNQKNDLDNLLDTTAADEISGGSIEVDKFTVGGGYRFGPGMTFRGSVAWGEYATTTNATTATAHSLLGDATPLTSDSASNDFTQIAVGMDVQF